MVMRKSSSPGLPYPTTPASPSMPHGHLNVDSADLPPLPVFKAGSPTFHRQSPYPEQENPWSDRSQNRDQLEKPLPPILRPGNGGYESQKPPLREMPEDVRAGGAENVTPRSSSESARSGNFWDENDEEERKAAPASSASQWQQEDQLTDGSPSEHLIAPIVKRKPVPSATGAATMDQPNHPPPPPPAFASNNPFRNDSIQEHTQTSDFNAWDNVPISHNAKGKEVVRESAPPNGHQQSLLDNDSPISFPTMQIQQASEESVWSQEPRHPQYLPSHPAAPPPPIPEVTSPFSSQPPLISVNTEDQPVNTEFQSTENPWNSEKISLAVPQASGTQHSSQEDVAPYHHDLLDHGQQTVIISLEDEHSKLRSAVEAPPNPYERLPINGHDTAPPLPGRRPEQVGELYEPPDGPPPPRKPPRPTLATSVTESQISKMQEQRNETYQIKHFNWFDHSTNKLRRSSMLTQNKNGPCPLLALVNALILGAKQGSQDTLDNALRSREQVSLGLMIETLMDELLSGGHEDSLDSLPDLDELNAFLMRLHTGMNANPRFDLTEQQPNLMDARNSRLHLPQSSNSEMGTFEATQDIKLYSSFSIPLVHGWLPSRADPARIAFNRSAQTYEDAQALMFGEEELEYKLSNGGLSEEEQQLWQDITAIKDFLKSHPTQLSPFGLEVIHDSLTPGSFAIMFRNDHFSTIYKHPETGQLFTLVTDAGYADRDEIVWESLVDVNGQDCEFFSGDFRDVGNNQNEAISAPEPGPRRSSQYLSSPNVADTPISPQERQEQHDADFAMALQMQEEEEQAAARARRPGGRQGRGASEGSIPIPIRPRENREVRPMIPPRTARTQNPGVNRPAEAEGEEAPPLYEEAVKGRPYIPPLGSPHHPTADPSPMSSTSQLTGVISNNDPPPPLIDRAGPSAQPIQRRPQQRRTSAYSEMSQTLGAPGAYPQARRLQSYGEPAQGARLRRGAAPLPKDERECVVM